MRELDLPDEEEERGPFLVDAFFGNHEADIVDVRCPDVISPNFGGILLTVYSASIENRVRSACPHRDSGLNDLCGTQGNTVFLAEKTLLEVMRVLDEIAFSEWIDFLNQESLEDDEASRLSIKIYPEKVTGYRERFSRLKDLEGREDLESVVALLNDIAVYYDILGERRESGSPRDPLGLDVAKSLFQEISRIAKTLPGVHVSQRSHEKGPLLTHAHGGVLHFRDTEKAFERSEYDLLRCFPSKRTTATMEEALREAFELEVPAVI